MTETIHPLTDTQRVNQVTTRLISTFGKVEIALGIQDPGLRDMSLISICLGHIKLVEGSPVRRAVLPFEQADLLRITAQMEPGPARTQLEEYIATLGRTPE